MLLWISKCSSTEVTCDKASTSLVAGSETSREPKMDVHPERVANSAPVSTTKVSPVVPHCAHRVAENPSAASRVGNFMMEGYAESAPKFAENFRGARLAL